MNLPYAVAVDGNGNLFIADANNQRIREVVVSTAPPSAPLLVLGLDGEPARLPRQRDDHRRHRPLQQPERHRIAAGPDRRRSTATRSSSAARRPRVGTFSNVTLGVQDAGNNIGSRTFTITINTPP